MSHNKSKTVLVPDQFEIHPVNSYHKTYSDRIFLPIKDSNIVQQLSSSNRRIVRNHSDKNGFFDDSNLTIGYKTTLRNLSSLFGNGFRIQKFWQPNVRINGTNLYLSAIGNNLKSSSSLVPQENILSPSQNIIIKHFCNQEQYCDSALPRPADIVVINGGKFVQGEAEYAYPNSWIFPNPAYNFECTTFGLKTQPRSFKLLLGGHGNYTKVTSSSDSNIVSDNEWYCSYPFQNKYRNLDRLAIPGFDKSYSVFLTQSSMGRFGGSTYTSGGLDLITFNSPSPFSSSIYTIQWCFETIGKQRDAGTSPWTGSPWDNRRRYINLIDVEIEVSGYKTSTNTKQEIVLRQTGSLQLPNIYEIYKGFYGVFHANNLQETPYYNAIEYPSGAYEQGGRWRVGANVGEAYNETAPSSLVSPTLQLNELVASWIETNKLKGWRLHEDYENSTLVIDNRLRNTGKFPIHEYMAGYAGYGYYQSVDTITHLVSAGSFAWFPVEDFNIHYLKLTGWKYGIYHGLPSYSNCYYRRNKYGQFRDRLEQRQYTKFISISSENRNKKNKTNYKTLQAAVVVRFLSGSTAYITSSNPSLNVTDSGIYDYEAKSGQPFSDSRV